MRGSECRTKCSISQFLFCKRFPYNIKVLLWIGKKSFIISDDFENPNICSRALKDANWIQTMDVEMKEFEMNGTWEIIIIFFCQTWEIIERPKGKKIYLVTHKLDDTLNQYKTRRIKVNGHPQIYDMTIRRHFLSWQKWTLFVFYSIFLLTLGETILVWCQKKCFWTETWRRIVYGDSLRIWIHKWKKQNMQIDEDLIVAKSNRIPLLQVKPMRLNTFLQTFTRRKTNCISSPCLWYRYF